MTQTNITIPDLYALYLETSELVRNRPDAVCTEFKGKGRSIYQRKLVNIKRYAEQMKPRSPTEKVFLEAILGHEVEKPQEMVKVQWFPQVGGLQ